MNYFSICSKFLNHQVWDWEGCFQIQDYPTFKLAWVLTRNSSIEPRDFVAFQSFIMHDWKEGEKLPWSVSISGHRIGSSRLFWGFGWVHQTSRISGILVSWWSWNFTRWQFCKLDLYFHNSIEVSDWYVKLCTHPFRCTIFAIAACRNQVLFWGGRIARGVHVLTRLGRCALDGIQLRKSVYRVCICLVEKTGRETGFSWRSIQGVPQKAVVIWRSSDHRVPFGVRQMHGG